MEIEVEETVYEQATAAQGTAERQPVRIVREAVKESTEGKSEEYQNCPSYQRGTRQSGLGHGLSKVIMRVIPKAVVGEALVRPISRLEAT